MATITSVTFNTRAGSGTISLTHSSFPSTNCEVSSLDSIKIRSDDEEDSESASNVYLNIGELKVSIFNKLTNGSLLFNTIDSVTSTDSITLSLNFTTNASRSWAEEYIFTPQDVGYNWERREISITAQPDDTATDTIADIFTNNAGDVETVVNYSSGNTTENCMPANEYIDNVLSLFNSGNTNINNSTHYLNNGQTDGVESYLIVDYLAASSTDLAMETLFNLAVIEGSIVGSMMGYNFFTSRLDQTQKVTISQDNVESIEPKIGLKSYLTIRGVLDIGVESWWSVGELTGNNDNLNDDALKRLDYYFEDKYIDIATWDNANSRYDQGSGDKSAGTLSDIQINGDHKEGAQTLSVTSGSGATSVTSGDYVWIESPSSGFGRNIFYTADVVTSSELTLLTPIIGDISDGSQIVIINDTNTINELTETGVSAYAKTYGADGANRVELTVLGVDTIKPYESFELDSSFDAPLANKVYRASEAEYMFTEDKIKIKAYQI